MLCAQEPAIRCSADWQSAVSPVANRRYSQGVSEVKLFLQELRRQKFAGSICIEYERDWENTVSDIAQCIGYIRGFADAAGLDWPPKPNGH
jgi:hypothetical protein